MSVTVVRPGLLTTVQDLGRTGYAALGVPPSGAMDGLALRLANRLVGNPDHFAALELTIAGPELRFEADAWIAMTGARFDAELDDGAAPHGESFPVRRGEALQLGRSLEGARGYLAVSGGLDVPLVLGSRSTFVAGGFGGLDGRPLRAGDRLAFGPPTAERKRRRLRSDALPRYAAQTALRVVAGPEVEAFTAAARRSFFAASYRVSPRSDRMGLRLEGPRVEHVGGADRFPEGIAPGAIQVPADGAPIVLAVDRPTTGGYAQIGTVITADIWRLGQAKPGDRFRFVESEVEDARLLYQELEEVLRSAIEAVE